MKNIYKFEVPVTLAFEIDSDYEAQAIKCAYDFVIHINKRPTNIDTPIDNQPSKVIVHEVDVPKMRLVSVISKEQE